MRRSVVALVGEAGSGKTTAARHWCENRQKTGLTHWLRVDRLNAEGAFLHELQRMLSGPVEEGSSDIRRDLADPASVVDIACAIARQLQSIQQEVVIVLDGLEHVVRPVILGLLETLFRRTHKGVRWVLLTRRRLEGWLPNLLLSQEIEVIDSSELAFTHGEIRLLWAQTLGRSLHANELDRLHHVTEGWVAGVRLAMFAASEPQAEFEVARFSGACGIAAGYFAMSVLGAESAQERAFLLRTAMLDRLHPDLCNAVMSRSDGGVTIEHLFMNNVFLVPLKGEPGWFRYHHMFREYLLDHLVRHYVATLPSLHRRASEWFEANGVWNDACRHAAAANDRAWFVEIAGRCARAQLSTGDPSAILSWTSRLSDDELIAKGDVCTVHLLGLLLAHRGREVEILLNKARHGVFRHHVGWSREHLDRLDILAAACDPSLRAAGDEACTRHDPDAFAGIAIAVQAARHLRVNHFNAARCMALLGRQTGRDCGNRFLEAHSELLLCIAEYAQGDIKAASEISTRWCLASIHEGEIAAAQACVMLACMHYERGHLRSAATVLDASLSSVTRVGTPKIFCIAHVLRARLLSLDRRMPEAITLLDELQASLSQQSLTRYLAHVCFEKVRICLERGELARAMDIAKDFGVSAMSERGDFSGEREYDESWARYGSTQAMLWVHEGDYLRSQIAIQTLLESAQRAGRFSRALGFQMQLADCYHRSGRHRVAVETLASALRAGGQSCYLRSPFDETPGFSTFMKSIGHTGDVQIPNSRYFRQWLGMRRSRSTAEMLMLNAKEIEILGLVSRGLCNKEIGRSLQMPLATIKWHLRNTFEKLSVNSRTAAVALAREKRLI